jgi:hypothetical protein
MSRPVPNPALASLGGSQRRDLEVHQLRRHGLDRLTNHLGVLIERHLPSDPHRHTLRDVTSPGAWSELSNERAGAPVARSKLVLRWLLLAREEMRHCLARLLMR